MRSLILSLICLTALVGTAPAGSVADLGRRAERELEEGAPDRAITAARRMLELIWEKAPLGLGEAALAEGPVAGYGLWTPRKREVFRPGEPVTLYLEPYGYRFRRDRKARWVVALAVDLAVRTPAGKLLAEKRDIARIDLAARRPVFELAASITYRLEGLEPGPYVLETTLRDLNGRGRTRFETQIAIAGE